MKAPDNPTPMQQTPTWKRKQKLPQPRFQLRLIGAIAVICALTLVVHTILVGWQVMSLAGTLPSGGGHVAEALPSLLFRALGLSLVMVLPALLLIGVHLTFRIAGPLFRFERHLEQVAAGETTAPCAIRESDDLQDFCNLLNKGLEGARAQGAAQARAEADERASAA